MLKILIAGDLCPRDRCAKVLKDAKFEIYFGEISKIIKNTDYSLVNLECPIIKEGTPIKKQGPNLKTSPKIIDLIKYFGFKGVTLANNHFYDYGDEGVINTIRICEECGIDYVGGGRSLQEARTVLYRIIKNKKVAFINVCEYEFSIATVTTAGSNPIDIINNFNEIKKAKENADFVVVIVHGGHEHYNLPSPRMQDTYRFFVDAGADAVINHHQHCYSGYEFYKEKPIVYGLGNFYFDHPGKKREKWNEGYMLNLELDETIGISIIPYNQCNVEPSIELMVGEQLNSFNNHINQLNNALQNRLLLESNFKDFCNSKKKLYMSVLEPYPTIYLKFLYRKIGLPSLLKGRSLSFVKNFIMCESHLDVIKFLLK